MNKNKIGIDISDYSIELIEIPLKNNHKNIKAVRRLIEPGIVVDSRIFDAEKLSLILKSMLAGIKIDKDTEIVFGLPDAMVYSHRIALPSQIKKEIDRQIFDEAVKIFPINREDLLISYQRVNDEEKTDSESEFQIFAISQEEMKKWDKFFQKLGITVDIFDIESLANGRGLFREYPAEPVIVVDFGHRVCNLSIFSKEGLKYLHSINIGGKLIENAWNEKLNIDEKKSQAMLTEVDITKKTKEAEIAGEVVNELIAEIGKDIEYYNKKEKVFIKKLIIIGGASQMKGFFEYFSKIFSKLEIKPGRPWIKLNKDSLYFVKAIGLALRTDSKYRDQLEPGFGRVRQGETTNTAINFIKNIYKNKPAILISVVVFLLVILSPIIIREKEEKNAPIVYTEEIEYEITKPIAGEPASLARIIAVSIKNPVEKNQIKLTAEKEAMDALLENEILWPQPLDIDLESELIYPLTLKYIAVNRQNLDDLLLDILSAGEEKYSIDQTKVKKAIYNNNNNVSLLGSVIIRADAEIPEKTKIIIRPEEKKYLEIKQISSALNIRKGPGTQFAVVGQAKAGEQFEYINNENNWYQIKIDEQTSGWVISDLVEVIDD